VQADMLGLSATALPWFWGQISAAYKVCRQRNDMRELIGCLHMINVVHVETWSTFPRLS